MKKSLLFLAGVLVISSFFMVNKAVAAIEPQIDQYCKTTRAVDADYNAILSVPYQPVVQTFKPAFNRLTSIRVLLAPDTPEVSKASLTLADNSGTPIKTMGINVDYLSDVQYYDWEPSSPITLTPGETYQIKLEHVSGGTGIYFVLSTNPECYSHGEVVGFTGYSASTVKDIEFATFGYNAEAPAPETPSGGTSGTTSGITGTTSGTPASSTNNSATAGIHLPAAKTSTAFNPPTNLIATQKDDSVSLSWTKSTSDTIDGYKVFRKAGETAFMEIDTTGKEILTFEDKNATAGLAYIYIVRSYKGAEQSANSNEASITLTKQDAAASTNTANSAKTPWYKSIWLYNGIGVILIILGGFCFYFLRKRGKLLNKP